MKDQSIYTVESAAVCARAVLKDYETLHKNV